MTVAKKTPQDRKPKATAPVSVMGVELSASVDDIRDRLGDWEVAELMSVVQDNDAEPGARLSATVKALRFLLADDYAKVKTELRAANDGTLTHNTMSEFMSKLFEALAPNS